MPAIYFDKRRDLLPFIFYTETQVLSSPYIHKNEKCNSVLTSINKYLCRSYRRNRLAAFSETDQKRPLCCNSLIKQIYVCVCTPVHSSVHVHMCNWKDAGKGTEAHLQQYILNIIYFAENPTKEKPGILQTG